MLLIKSVALQQTSWVRESCTISATFVFASQQPPPRLRAGPVEGRLDSGVTDPGAFTFPFLLFAVEPSRMVGGAKGPSPESTEFKEDQLPPRSPPEKAQVNPLCLRTADEGARVGVTPFTIWISGSQA